MAQCPTCGAEVEFRYDDSFVRICDHCRAAVVRTDRGIETLGRVADLTPIDSPLRLFASGTLGHESFLLVGKAQIRQSTGGLSQEWYAKFDGRWGWLAEGQGRFYLTFEIAGAALPPFEQLVPGAQTALPHRPTMYAVGERGEASYVAAAGELPFKLAVGATYRFVDLSDGQGAFATIDYGDGSEPPVLYEGRQVTLAELGITGGESGPLQDRQITATRFSCPSCGAPIDLHAAAQSLRVVCGHCNEMINVEGGARELAGKLQRKASPSIPLGSKGTFAEGEMAVIGFLQRSALVDDSWYPFEEYLLFDPRIGFRWLVSSDASWSYVQPVAPGAVSRRGTIVVYDDATFRVFQTRTQLRVDQVHGELYWRVTENEVAFGEDFIAPPAMLSCEETNNEQSWSLSTYLSVGDVKAAFPNQELDLDRPSAIAPNRPYPIRGFGRVASLSVVALIVAAIAASSMATGKVAYKHSMTLGKGGATTPTVTGSTPSAPEPAAPDPCREYETVAVAYAGCAHVTPPQRVQVIRELGARKSRWARNTPSRQADDTCQAAVATIRTAAETAGCPQPAAGSGEPPTEVLASTFFSDPFELSHHNVEMELTAPGIDNNWVSFAVDLIEEATDKVVSFDGGIEYYSGVDDGESWSEGSREETHFFGPLPVGKYVLRVEAQHGGGSDMVLGVTVKQGIFRWRYFLLAFGVLLVPFLAFSIHEWSYERRRWDNSAFGSAGAPKTPAAYLILAITVLFTVLWFLIKGMFVIFRVVAAVSSLVSDND